MSFWGGRDEIRQVFFQAWRRHRQGMPLEGVEAVIVDVARVHPEYHAILDEPDSHRDRDYRAEDSSANPFAHMGMHIALREQMALGQVAELRSLYEALAAKLGDPHAAEHRLMDCLIEAMWSSTRGQSAESVMLDCIQRMREKENLRPR